MNGRENYRLRRKKFLWFFLQAAKLFENSEVEIGW